MRRTVSASKGRVLVVDDDAVARELLSEALRQDAYEVETAAGGAEAIEKGRQLVFDVVLTDIRMTAVDGFTLL